MNRKSKLLALLLVLLLPVLAIMVAGWKITKDEERLLRLQEREFIESLRSQYTTVVEKFIKNYQPKLDVLLLDLHMNDISRVRDMARLNPYIDQIFILTKNGQLLFPLPDQQNYSSKELEFIERTKSIWEQRSLLYTKPVKENSSKFELGKGTSAFWYPYQSGDGLHLLYYTKLSDRIIGFEISKAKFISELLNVFFDQNLTPVLGQSIFLKDERNTLIYSWGSLENTNEALISSPLSFPLSSWRLDVHPKNAGNIGKSLWFNFFSGSLILALVLLLSSIYIIKQYRKEMLEAENKVSFVNQVSHELKTPLTNIRMYAELLQLNSENLEENQAKQVDIIVRESQRLSRLISNVLTFGQKEKKSLKLNLKSDDFNEIVREVAAFFEPSFKEKRIAMILKLEELGKRNIDRDVVYQILYNLFSNVEKYAAISEQVEIATHASGENVYLNFKDYGPGIGLKDKDKIFELFYRVSNSNTDGVSGTGIGLSISRELARLHGGDLILVSSDRGAHFELSLLAPSKEN